MAVRIIKLVSISLDYLKTISRLKILRNYYYLYEKYFYTSKNQISKKQLIKIWKHQIRDGHERPLFRNLSSLVESIV